VPGNMYLLFGSQPAAPVRREDLTATGREGRNKNGVYPQIISF
jgi:hypothetical protein